MIDVLVWIERGLFYLLLFSFIAYVIRCRIDKSMLITVATVLIAEFFMLAIEGWLWKIENKQVLWFVWFNTFAWCEMAVVYCIAKLHQRDHVPFSFSARSVIYSYLLLATAQLSSYLDRAYLKVEFIADTCKLVILSIAISVMLTLLYAVVKALVLAYQEKKAKYHVA